MDNRRRKRRALTFSSCSSWCCWIGIPPTANGCFFWNWNNWTWWFDGRWYRWFCLFSLTLQVFPFLTDNDFIVLTTYFSFLFHQSSFITMLFILFFKLILPYNYPFSLIDYYKIASYWHNVYWTYRRVHGIMELKRNPNTPCSAKLFRYQRLNDFIVHHCKHK